jgi:hypothetical protein
MVFHLYPVHPVMIFGFMYSQFLICVHMEKLLGFQARAGDGVGLYWHPNPVF